jgi:hypothetical protein
VRLSQKAWNNVLIFATLAMIAIFNLSHKMIDPDQTSSTPMTLLPANALIQEINFGTHKIERIGRGWRLQSDIERTISEDELRQIVDAWTMAQVEPVANIKTGDAYVIIIWLAGEPRAQVVQLSPANEDAYLIIDNKQYQLMSPHYSTLLIKE